MDYLVIDRAAFIGSARSPPFQRFIFGPLHPKQTASTAASSMRQLSLGAAIACSRDLCNFMQASVRRAGEYIDFTRPPTILRLFSRFWERPGDTVTIYRRRLRNGCSRDEPRLLFFLPVSKRGGGVFFF